MPTPPPAATSLWHRLRQGQLGAGWMIVASLLFALMGLFVKLGSAHFSAIELVFYRTFVGMLGIAGVVLVRRQSLATAHIVPHLKRSLFGYAALSLYFYAITELPLATAVTLNYTSPLFLAGISVFWLKEKLSGRLGLSLLLGFVGVVLLLKPTLAKDAWLAGVLGLVSGFLASIAYQHVRELGRLGEPEWRVVFYFTVIANGLGGVWLAVAQGFRPLDMETIPLLIGLGATATLAQLAMTRAYQEGRKLVVANLAYLTVVFSSVIGVVMWGDVLPPESYVAMGLIVASGMIASRR